MNERSLRALEFSKIINRVKEYALSPMAKETIQSLQPAANYNEIVKRQDETEESVKVLLKNSNVPIDGLKEIQHWVRKTTIGSYLDPGELIGLLSFLKVSKRMKVFFKKDKEQEDLSLPILKDLIREVQTFPELEARIDRSVLSESELSDDASPELKQIRRQLHLASEKIRSTLQNFITSSKNQTYLQDQIITIRQNRYVVPVKQEYRNQVKGMIHDQSTSGATLFIEPMAIVELNNKLKELKLSEEREVERILREISWEISLIAEDLLINQDRLGTLDYIFAKGKYALAIEGKRPEVNQVGYVNLKNARHPLLEPSEVVPTTIWIGKDFSTLVITGPNTGGKTVSLKTLGLLCLMGQSGLQIPADHGTEISVFDHIFADIGDEQSIEQSLSTFSSHMTNIVEIFKNLTENSLVLFDELGAGTDPTEGAALAMAILENLREKGTKVVATTHYSELKQYALIHKDVENASVEFNIQTLRPTYKLSIGVPGKSNAFEISRKLGLSDEIIEQAKTFISHENIQFEDVLQNIESNKSHIETEKHEIDRLKREIEQTKNRYEERVRRLENQKDRLVQDAKKESRRIIKEAKEEAEGIIKKLRELEQSGDRRHMNQEIEQARIRLGEKALEYKDDDVVVEESTKRQAPKDLKAGEKVRIISLNQEGYVLEPEDDRGEVLVQAGIMKVNIKAANLERIAKNSKVGEKTSTSRMVRSKSRGIKTEIDVRGKNLEEAMLEVDKYLDDCAIAGLAQVTVIHGVGTGVLKAGLHQMFKTHRHVKSYRSGKYGEGGDGVSIVELS